MSSRRSPATKAQFVAEERIDRSRVLARSHDKRKRLLWESGHTGWSGLLQRKYYSAKLKLEYQSAPGAPTEWIVLTRGGRLTAARIAEVASRIDALLGKGAAQKILIGSTMVLYSGRPR